MRIRVDHLWDEKSDEKRPESVAPLNWSFEADETLTWGVPGAETIVGRRWVARRH
jgi:hypothetical protein